MSGPATSAASSNSPVLADLHVAFVHRLDQTDEWRAQHLKLNGVYWGLGALSLLKRMDYERADVLRFVLSCRNEDGGFGGNVGHDSHMLYTLSAIQLLCQFDALNEIDVKKTATWIAQRQRDDGAFTGDEWGEVDTRFVYIALNALHLLRQQHLMNVEAAVQWILSCQNWDGGFGATPGAESHAGQIFCCVGALRIAKALHRIDVDRLAAWLAFRQLPSGGLNGRPEKKADVCYSWWVISSLSVMERTTWVDREALFTFILSCQDADDGGIADKPGNTADVYHTFFGLCGLSLLRYDGYALGRINPIYALPYDVLERVGITEAEGLRVGMDP